MTAKIIEDTVTLQPVLPASGLSACPGQDVTLNCTIVRMTTAQKAEQPTLLTWVYRNINISSATSDSLNNSVYTAVFNYSHNFVTSIATIINVSLSHNNSSISCQASQGLPKDVTIRITGIAV